MNARHLSFAGLFSVIVMVYFTGCSDSTSSRGGGDGQVDITDCLPLAVGNSWTYKTYDLGGNYSDTYVLTFEQAQTIGGATVYLFDDPPDGWGFAMKSDGLYELRGALTTSNLHKIMNNPAQIGDIIESPSWGSAEVLAINAEIATELGTYDCIKLKYHTNENPQDDVVLHFAQGIGNVYLAHYDTDGNPTGHEELAGYDFTPGPNPSGDFFPLSLNSIWTYDNGNSVRVSSYSTVEGVTYATISNLGSGGQINIERTETEVGYSGFSNPDYIMVSGYFSHNPLLKLPVTEGLHWTDEGNSNGYDINFSCTITATNLSVTIQDTTYHGCAELDIVIDYPMGYDWPVYILSQKFYFCPDVGCIKRISYWTEGPPTTIELVSYNIP